MRTTWFLHCSQTPSTCSSLCETYCQHAASCSFSAIPLECSSRKQVANDHQLASIIISSVLCLLVRFVSLLSTWSAQTQFNLYLVQFPVMHRAQLPSIHSLLRPHIQVRHWLPSVVRKQGLLQSH